MTDKYSTEDMKTAVETGAARLDEIFPTWMDAIDLGSLRLASGQSCILGQSRRAWNGVADDGTPIYTYHDMARAMYDRDETRDGMDCEMWQARRGFVLPPKTENGELGYNVPDDDDPDRDVWDVLTGLWRTLITARRGGEQA